MPQAVHGVTDSEALAALGRVLGAAQIGRDSRSARILRYIVTEAIEGRSDRIKAVTIAQDVLGRGADFDPASDSIVRVEARRLRDLLDAYYAGEGRNDPVRISVPRGAYAPAFERTGALLASPLSPPPEAEAPPSRWRVSARAIAIVVAVAGGVVMAAVATRVWLSEAPKPPVAPLGAELRLAVTADADVADAARQNTIAALSRFKNLVIELAFAPGSGRNAQYELQLRSGGDGRGVVSAALLHRRSSAVLAGRRFEPEEIADGGDVRALTPYRIWLGQLAQRNGLLERDYLTRGDFGPTLRCRALTEAYFSEQTDAKHLAARSCVQSALDDGLRAAEFYVELAILAREEHANQRNLLPGDPLDRAVAAARAAIALEPFNPIGHYALMTALYAAGSYSEARAAGEKALELNPFDGEIVGGFATRLNVTGDHLRALELLDVAGRLAPGLPNRRAYGVFLAHFGLGHTRDAAEAALALRGSRDPSYLAALAIGHAARGERVAAGRHFAALRDAEPDYRDMYVRRGYAPALVDKLVEALDALAAADGASSAIR